MIVLDTNILSELMRPGPNSSVLAWVDQTAPADLYTTAITRAEILAGLALMPIGTGKDALVAGASRLFELLFKDRILPFDSRTAPLYAEIVARRKRAGRSYAALDCQIAAITSAARAILATRNIKDFDDCGFVIVDPWSQ